MIYDIRYFNNELQIMYVDSDEWVAPQAITSIYTADGSIVDLGTTYNTAEIQPIDPTTGEVA